MKNRIRRPRGERWGRLNRRWEQLLASRGYARWRAMARRIWDAPLWMILMVMGVVLGSIVSYAATRSTGRAPAPEVTTTASPSPTPQHPATPEPTASGPGLETFQAQVARIEARYDVQIGIAVTGVSPVGSQLTATWTAGSISSAPAWGTIDLPIAVAANRLSTPPPNFTYMLTKSISKSSLSSDDALNSFLGDANAAAAKTDEVLRSFGDRATTVSTSSSRQGVPAFAQTDWSVSAQARFASQLWCSSQDAMIRSRMQFVDDEHSYGFGRTIGSFIKTSEGTDEADRPVLRQVAIVPNDRAYRVGAALAVIGKKNDLADARAAADAVASRAFFGASGVDGGHC
ncbi:hypothetical protein SAMN05443377_10974 [Propionibacterium cyclohexanicum]|uniref:Beta-lactamase enzyme family protein n=1 Tax=Propionibacterium cyclohexanicum TaxID=64702 RepID=A0A1H9RV07_9ACTN|nr:hypothetical protein [Propionibacterium cyclohexanicum]SER76632.1 hypothetical protein SAMN05443377_10974 [Propionibacterium cyclohexanicum]